GDFKVIAKQQVHLRKFLSEIVPLEVFNQVEESPSEHAILGSEKEEKTVDRQLEEIIARVSGSYRISEERHTPLMNLGIDSLMIEEIRVAINERFGCTFKATEIYDNCTLSKLHSLVASRAKPQLERSAAPAEPETSPSTAQNSDIAIIGYSGAFSGCRNVEDFWENLLTGKECITRTESSEEGFVDAAGLIDDIDKFDHNFWKMTHDDASMLDPQLRVFVQNAYNSLESAGYVRQRNDLKVGVFAGAEPSEYGDPSEEAEGSLHRLFKLNMKDFVATFTAHMLNLRGPAIGVYTACSTAL
ncbi:Beta-ketoacyl synthase protein, partial [Teladorsagia circumcincta]